MEIRTLTGHSDTIKPVVFIPDGLTLASGSRDCEVKLWVIDSDLDGTPNFWEEQMGFKAAKNDADNDKSCTVL